MELAEDDLRALAASIWDAVLQLPLTGGAAAGPAREAGATMSACVLISGAWQGTVSLSCGSDFAARAAGIMFGLGPGEDARPSEVKDALGELANMIGGNVKALIPETCRLSLPAVVEGPDWTVRIPKARVLVRIPLSCEGRPITVCVMEKEAAANAAC